MSPKNDSVRDLIDLQIDTDDGFKIVVPGGEFSLFSQSTTLMPLVWIVLCVIAMVAAGVMTLGQRNSPDDFVGSMLGLGVFTAVGIFLLVKAVADIAEEQTLEFTPESLMIRRERWAWSSKKLYSPNDLISIEIVEAVNTREVNEDLVRAHHFDGSEHLVAGRSRADQEFIAEAIERWMDGSLFDERGRFIADFA